MASGKCDRKIQGDDKINKALFMRGLLLAVQW